MHPSVPFGEGRPTYFFFAIALFGAAMTPYEMFFFFFFSSGAVEERWTRKDLNVNRANVFIGFSLGGLLSLALVASAALVLAPRGVQVENLSQVALPTALVLGKLGLAVLLVGVFAATFGAALETGLSGRIHGGAVFRMAQGCSDWSCIRSIEPRLIRIAARAGNLPFAAPAR